MTSNGEVADDDDDDEDESDDDVDTMTAMITTLGIEHTRTEGNTHTYIRVL